MIMEIEDVSSKQNMQILPESDEETEIESDFEQVYISTFLNYQATDCLVPDSTVLVDKDKNLAGIIHCNWMEKIQMNL